MYPHLAKFIESPLFTHYCVINIAYIVTFFSIKIPLNFKTASSSGLHAWLLVLNGFLFGSIGCGFVVLMVFCNLGIDGFDLSQHYDPAVLTYDPLNPSFDSIKHQSILHMLYLHFYIHAISFVCSILNILTSGKRSIGNLLHQLMIHFLILYVLTYTVTIRSFHLLIMIINAMIVSNQAYYVLKIGFPKNNNNTGEKNCFYIKIFTCFNTLCSIIGLFHATYLANNIEKCTDAYLIKPHMIYTGIIVFIASFSGSIISWRKLFKPLESSKQLQKVE